MLRIIIIIWALWLGLESGKAEQNLEKYVAEQILGGRYMSPANGCSDSPIDVAGWPKVALQRCEYEVTDTFADGKTTKKKAVVYLANPSSERVLVWLRTACTRVQKSAIDSCIRNAAQIIRSVSGGQFPVGGLVWEDLYCGKTLPLGKCKLDRHGNKLGDGIYEGYIFRNGVTVRIKGFSNGSTDPVENPDTLELWASAPAIIGIKTYGGFARIISTTREQFLSFTGRKNIPVGRSDRGAAQEWSDIVGSTFRAALSADENPLITAWLCNEYKQPKACKPR